MFRPVLHLGVSSARDAVCSHYGVYYLKDQCLVRYCGCVYLGPVPIKLAIIIIMSMREILLICGSKALIAHI